MTQETADRVVASSKKNNLFEQAKTMLGATAPARARRSCRSIPAAAAILPVKLSVFSVPKTALRELLLFHNIVSFLRLFCNAATRDFPRIPPQLAMHGKTW
ncbi:MAG: hypothetical protein IJD20_06275, partial [Oscillospiraceae bacterium]|nr:hypothetical protein [Oscillospiraceae bacterium]